MLRGAVVQRQVHHTVHQRSDIAVLRVAGEAVGLGVEREAGAYRPFQALPERTAQQSGYGKAVAVDGFGYRRIRNLHSEGRKTALELPKLVANGAHPPGRVETIGEDYILDVAHVVGHGIAQIERKLPRRGALFAGGGRLLGLQSGEHAGKQRDYGQYPFHPSTISIYSCSDIIFTPSFSAFLRFSGPILSPASR